MSELFTIPECKSPRLQWIEENGIVTAQGNSGKWYAVLPKEDEESSDPADLAMLYDGTMRCAKGQTEDDALANLAKAIGLRLWNERGMP